MPVAHPLCFLLLMSMLAGGMNRLVHHTCGGSAMEKRPKVKPLSCGRCAECSSTIWPGHVRPFHVVLACCCHHRGALMSMDHVAPSVTGRCHCVEQPEFVVFPMSGLSHCLGDIIRLSYPQGVFICCGYCFVIDVWHMQLRRATSQLNQGSYPAKNQSLSRRNLFSSTKRRMQSGVGHWRVWVSIAR